MKLGRLVLTLVLAAGVSTTLTAGTGTATAATTGTFGDTCVPRPTRIPARTRLSTVSDVEHGRLRTYTMTSPAIGVTHVNVLLPAGYGQDSSRRYPVLYLLHGALGSYVDWASTASLGGEPQGGDVEARVGALPIIVVMPDDSPNGSYSDWYGISAHDATLHPAPATPAWETYDIDDLVPWVDSTFATRANASGRIIAGLSSGGGGAAKYAANHPGLFGFVGTFSGAVDNNLVDSTADTYSSSDIFHSTKPPDDRCTFGDPFTSDAQSSAYYWYDNDPTYQASNLTEVKLFVASGNGKPTAADARTIPAARVVQGAIESVVDDESHHFVAAIRQAGLGANLTTDFYGAGVHAWHYWQQDLTAFLQWLRPQLDQSVPAPSSFSFRTAHAVSEAWGWSFHFSSGLAVPNVNTAEQFVYLSRVSARGLTASGYGSLRITSSTGSYPPGSAQTVTVGRATTTVRANGHGQLTFNIALGPAATHPQTEFPASGPPAGTPRVQVSISPVPNAPHGSDHVWLVIAGSVAAALVALALAGRALTARRRSPG